MNLEKVKQFLEDNKDNEEVKLFLEELRRPTREDVEGFLETDEGRKLLQPRLDQYFTKGLNTWKEKNLEKLVEERVKELYPEETEEQKRIRALEKKIEEAERRERQKELLNKAILAATEKGLPTDMVQFFVSEDEETTLSNLNMFEEKYKAAVQKAVDEKFKANGTEFKEGGTGSTQTISIAELAKEANIRNQ